MKDPLSLHDLADRLVETRYPYQVKAVLDEIDDPDDLSLVVGAALARSKQAGFEKGRERTRQEIKERLGL